MYKRQIYHGVTLGGTGKDTGKRHPTLGNNVLIGAGTKVLGPVYIGDNSRIGAGSVVLRNLPANCTAVGVPAEVVRINNKAVNPADDLDQQDLPDIVAQRLTDLDRRLGALENAAQGDTPPTAAQIAARQKSYDSECPPLALWALFKEFIFFRGKSENPAGFSDLPFHWSGRNEEVACFPAVRLFPQESSTDRSSFPLGLLS